MPLITSALWEQLVTLVHVDCLLFDFTPSKIFCFSYMKLEVDLDWIYSQVEMKIVLGSCEILPIFRSIC